MNPRDALLSRNQRRHVDSLVDLDGEHLRWQNLSELEKSSFENLAQHNNKAKAKWAKVNLRLRVIVACAVDDDGKRIFSEGDILQMQQLDGNTVQALSDEAMAHVGWTDDDVEEMEYSVKNSSETSDEDLR